MCVSNRSHDHAANRASRLYAMNVIPTAAIVPLGMELLGFSKSPKSTHLLHAFHHVFKFFTEVPLFLLPELLFGLLIIQNLKIDLTPVGDKRRVEHLTRHVGARHDSGAAVEHDSKDCGEAHKGTGGVVHRVAG